VREWKWNNTFKRISNEISKANKGRKVSKETRDKISKALKGRIGIRGEANPNYGRKASDEARLKYE
jgi:hypothetical protein